MSEVTLRCLSPKSAQAVADENGDAGKPSNYVTVNGADLVITYVDKRFPLNLADWAGENEHAADAEAARVIGSL